MATSPDLTHDRAQTHAASRTTIFYCIAGTALLAAVAVTLPMIRHPAADLAESLVAQCDRASVAAAAEFAATGDLPARSAAVRRERERSFNACIEEAAQRGMAARP